MIDWLRHQPLLILEKHYAFVHAGLLPQWTTGAAKTMAEAVESALQSPNYAVFLKHLYGKAPDYAHGLANIERLREGVNGLTRLRICDAAGKMDLTFAGTADAVPKGYYPWFMAPGRQHGDTTILFGHWAALGLYQGHGVIGLDSGCVWGKALTAYCLETGELYQVNAKRQYAQGD
jgi:bis(5'-nucleosyl)-tetraphosphatase (symmetrical)